MCHELSVESISSGKSISNSRRQWAAAEAASDADIATTANWFSCARINLNNESDNISTG